MTTSAALVWNFSVSSLVLSITDQVPNISHILFIHWCHHWETPVLSHPYPCRRQLDTMISQEHTALAAACFQHMCCCFHVGTMVIPSTKERKMQYHAISYHVFLATKSYLLGNSSPWALGILWYVAKRQEKRYKVDTTSKSAVLGGVDLPHNPKIPFSPERNGIQYAQLVPGPAFLLPMPNWQGCRFVSWNPAKTAVCLMDQALAEKRPFFC